MKAAAREARGHDRTPGTLEDEIVAQERPHLREDRGVVYQALERRLLLERVAQLPPLTLRMGRMDALRGLQARRRLFGTQGVGDDQITGDIEQKPLGVGEGAGLTE